MIRKRDAVFRKDHAQTVRPKEPRMKRTITSLVAAALIAFVAAAPARAEDVKAGDLVISQAWTRATPGGARTGGGFLTIENKGTSPDKLVGGRADAGGKG